MFKKLTFKWASIQHYPHYTLKLWRERFGSHSWAPDVFLLYFWTLFVYVQVPCNVTVIIYNVVNCNMFTNGGNSKLLEHSVQLRTALLTAGTVLYLSRTGKRKEGMSWDFRHGLEIYIVQKIILEHSLDISQMVELFSIIFFLVYCTHDANLWKQWGYLP